MTNNTFAILLRRDKEARYNKICANQVSNAIRYKDSTLVEYIIKLADYLPSCHFSGVGFIFSMSQRGRHDSSIDIDVVDIPIIPMETKMYLSDSIFLKGISYPVLPLLRDQLNVMS